MAENVKIVIEAEDRASSVLSNVQRGLNNVSTAAKGTGSALDSTSKSVKGLEGSFSKLESAASAAGLAIGAGFSLDYINTIQTLDNKLRLVTNSTTELNTTYKQLFDVAQNTRQSLDGTVNLYSKLALSAESLGLNTSELAKVTENFNKTLLISGTTTQGANAALYQFAQAMQSGRLQGDELRTLLETTPKFMDILRQTTGLTTAELRKLASDGFLSSSIVAQALIDATDELNSNMDKMPITVRQATQQLSNSIQSTVRDFLDATEGSELLVGGIQFLEENVKTVTVALGLLASALAIGALINVITFAFAGLSTAVTVATTAITALRVAVTALAATPLGRLASLLGLAAGAVVALASDTDTATESTTKLDKSTNDLADSQKASVGPSEKMKKLMEEQGITAATTSNKFTDLLGSIQQQIKYSGMFSDERKNMIDIDKALQDTIEQGRKQNKKYTEEEIANMRARLVAAMEERDEKLKVTQELENRFKDYISYIKKQQDTGISDQQKFDNAVKQFTDDRLKYTEQQERQTAEYLEALRKDYSERYVKLIKDTNEKNLTDEQKYVRDFNQLEDDFLNGRLSKNLNFEDALEAIRKNYSEKYIKLIKDQNDANLTESQKFQRDLAQLEEDFREGRLSKEVNFEDAKDALRSKYNKKFVEDAKKATEEDQGAFGAYSAKMLELNEAYRAGLFKTDEQYFALVNKARQDYINATVSEYSTLYKTVEDNLLNLLNINKSKWPLIKDVIKLFGTDVDKILKDSFTQGIDYIKSFTTTSTGEFKGMQTETTNIFSGIGNFISNIFSGSGTLLGTIGSWVSSALNLFKGFGSSLWDIFKGIGSWMGDLFGSGGSIVSTVTSGLGNVVSTIGSVASTIGGGISSAVSTIGSALGIGGAGAAAGGAAAGGAAAGAAGSAGAAGAAGGSIAGTIAGTVVGAVGMGAAIVGGLKLLDKAFGGDLFRDYKAEEDAQIQQYRQQKAQYDAAVAQNKAIRADNASAANAYADELIRQGFSTKYKSVPNYINGTMQGYKQQWALYKNNEMVGPWRDVNLNNAWGFYGNDGLTQNAINTDKFRLWYMSGGGSVFFGDDPIKFGAKGLAYNNGSLINNATIFGTRDGMAVGGELGTEAIMPLTRDSQGRLGVSAEGAMGQSVNINFTINAVDAKGIDTMLVEKKALITNIVRSALQDRGVRV